MPITDPIDHRRVHHHVKGMTERLEKLRREHGPKTPDELAADHASTDATRVVASPPPPSGPTPGGV